MGIVIIEGGRIDHDKGSNATLWIQIPWGYPHLCKEKENKHSEESERKKLTKDFGKRRCPGVNIQNKTVMQCLGIQPLLKILMDQLYLGHTGEKSNVGS